MFVHCPTQTTMPKMDVISNLVGSCAAVIGHYVIDPWLLFEAGVAHELIRPQDYASDSVVLRLFSHDSIKRSFKRTHWMLVMSVFCLLPW